MDPCTTDTKTLLKQLTAQYYDDLNHAHERGQKVVWTNGLFPQEFFEAMDIQVAYPENLAATLGAKKVSCPIWKNVRRLVIPATCAPIPVSGWATSSPSTATF